MSAIAQDSGDEGELLGLLAYYVSADNKCGFLEPDTRDALNGSLQFALRNEAMTQQQRNSVEQMVISGELTKDIDCNSDEADFLATLIEDSVDAVEESLKVLMGQSSESEPKRFVGKEAVADQDAYMQQLPTGQLTEFAGCWGGIIGVWESELCFHDDGDTIELNTRPPDHSFTCTLSGPSRFNGTEAIMYALPGSSECQNRGQLSHFTSRCSMADEGRIECHGFVMIDSEETYVDKQFETYVAGLFPMSRTAADGLDGPRLTFSNFTSDFPLGMLANAQGCFETEDFFGTSAELCIVEETDTASIVFAQGACSVGGPAVRVGDQSVLSLLESESPCGRAGITFMTNSCTEAENGDMECFTYAMHDGWTFAAHEDANGRVPYIGTVVYRARN